MASANITGSIDKTHRSVSLSEQSDIAIRGNSQSSTTTRETTPIIAPNLGAVQSASSLPIDLPMDSRATGLSLKNEPTRDQRPPRKKANLPLCKLKLESFRCKPTIVAEWNQHCLLQIGRGYYIHLNAQTGAIVKWLTVYGNVAFVSPSQLLVVFGPADSLGLGAVYEMDSQEAIGYINLGYGEQVMSANGDCVLTRTTEGETYFHKLAELTGDHHAVRVALGVEQEKVTLARSGYGFLAHQPARSTPERKSTFSTTTKKDRVSTLTAYSLERPDGQIEYLKLDEPDNQTIMQTPSRLVRYDRKKKTVFVDSINYTTQRVASREISTGVCHLPVVDSSLYIHAMHYQRKVETLLFDEDGNVSKSKHGLLVRGPLPGQSVAFFGVLQSRLITCSDTFSGICGMQEAEEFVLCATLNNTKGDVVRDYS